MEPARLVQWLAGKSITHWIEWVLLNVTLVTVTVSAVRLALRKAVPAEIRNRVARAVPWLNRALDVIESLGASVMQLAAAAKRPVPPTPAVHPDEPGRSGR